MVDVIEPKTTLLMQIRHNAFPMRRYLNAPENSFSTTKSKIAYSDDYGYSAYAILDWGKKAIRVDIMSEHEKSLYKMNVRIRVSRTGWLKQTEYVKKNELSVSWTPQNRETCVALFIAVEVLVISSLNGTNELMKQYSGYMRSILSSYTKLWDSRHQTGDFTLLIDHIKPFVVHKAVLIGCSDFFHKQPTNIREISVSGASAEGVEAFAKCIYTGPYQMSMITLREVYILSSRFQVQWLSNFCASQLCASFHDDISYGEDQLKRFFDNAEAYTKSPQWMRLEKESPECAAYLLADVFINAVFVTGIRSSQRQN